MAAATCSSVLRSPERRGEGEMLRRRGDGGRGGDGSVMKQLRAREFLATTSRFPQLPATSMWEGVRTRALRYEDETAGYSEEKGCFCVGFDLTGNMLVGCMEDSTIRLLDPRQGGGGGGGGGGDGGGGARCRVVSILHGHSGPVNNFKFMDGYTLLTASDDKTVQQWDMRRLESSGCGRSGEGGGGEGERGGRRSSALVQKFVGHGGWVKNIEPLSRSEFLSSGLDGTVRIWDINEDGSSKVATGWRNNVILKHKKLCRMALSRDVNGERLIVSFCDEGGSTIIINDVDFSQALLDMHSKTSATTMLVEQTAISRILQMKKLYKNHNNFCRRRDYCIIPPSCLRKRNRLELLHEPRPGFTLSVLTGPRNRPNESLLLARRNSFSFINGEFMDQLCVYRLSGGQNDFVSDQMREWIHRRDSIPDQTETSLGNSSRKRKKGEIHVVHAYKAWQIFPKRLVGICEDSQSRDIFVDASMSPCGRLICSPYYRGLRLLNMEEALKQDPSQGVSTMEPLSVNLVNKHQAHVVTAQYHPFEPIVAAGSLDGMISVHEADRG